MDEQHPLDFVVLVTQTQFAAEIHTRSARRRTKNTPSVSVHEIASRRLELGMSQAELAAAINVKANLIRDVEQQRTRMSSSLAKKIQACLHQRGTQD